MLYFLRLLLIKAKHIINYLKTLPTRVRKDLIIDEHCRIDNGSKFEGKNRIGMGSLIVKSVFGYGTYIGRQSQVLVTRIGRFTSIGSNFRIIAGKHPTSGFVSTHPAFFSNQKQSGFSYTEENLFEEHTFADDEKKFLVSIGSDVWIGENVSILGGVVVGDGAVIAAGAMVVKNVEPYEIVGGVPARVIRRRFGDEEIKFLLEFAWWNKPPEWIRKNAQTFSDISRFIQIFREKK